MDRQPVTSSNIKSVGHDDLNAVLEVEFNTGRVYRYSGVSRFVFNDFLGAPSKGRYFHSQIKGVFEYEEVT